MMNTKVNDQESAVYANDKECAMKTNDKEPQ